MKTSLRSLCTTLSCALVFAACSGDSPQDPNNTNNNATTNATLSSLAISLGLDTVSVGSTMTPTVLARYSDGTDKDVTADVAWMSSNVEVVEITTDPLTFTALAEGTTTITADYMGMSSTVDVTVEPPALVSIELIPASGDFGIGGSLTVEVVATYSDGSNEQVTKVAEFESSRSNVAIVSAQESGRLVSFGQGTTTITATWSGMSTSGDYTVTEPQVEYMTISPERVRMNLVDPVQFAVTAVFSDNDPGPGGQEHVEDVTGAVTWSSSNEAVLTIDQNGLARALGDGEAYVTATAASGATVSTVARTVSVSCAYPDGHDGTVTVGKVIPPLFWLDAYTETQEVQDFSLEQQHCDTAVKSIIFKVAAGWCGPCRSLAQAMEPMVPQFHEAGAMIVHVMAETSGGSPANNMQANQIAQGWTPNEPSGPWPTFRVGSADTQGAVSPFPRALSAFPTTFVVRTSDMKVVREVVGAGTENELLSAAQNIDNL